MHAFSSRSAASEICLVSTTVIINKTSGLYRLKYSKVDRYFVIGWGGLFSAKMQGFQASPGLQQMCYARNYCNMWNWTGCRERDSGFNIWVTCTPLLTGWMNVASKIFFFFEVLTQKRLSFAAPVWNQTSPWWPVWWYKCLPQRLSWSSWCISSDANHTHSSGYWIKTVSNVRILVQSRADVSHLDRGSIMDVPGLPSKLCTAWALFKLGVDKDN